MPLTTNAETLTTSTSLVSTLRTAAGPSVSKAHRPAHAKGHLLTGSFTPNLAITSSLTTAPHLTSATPIPLTARFSSSTGLPKIPDTNPNANPRGLALRFHLPSGADGRRKHTDIVTHSTPLFPTRTGAEFLQFLQAATSPDAATLVPKFLEAHPSTQRFLGTPKPSPESFASEAYFGVNAFWLVGGEAGKKRTAVRYRVEPVEGRRVLGEEEVKGKGEEYLYEDLVARLLGEQKKEIRFKLKAQVALPTDVVDDATVLWPEEREVVELGEVVLDNLVQDGEESERLQKEIIFDPIPRVEGVEASEDPLLEVRANVYLVSGRERRAA
ncbi:heme-dependent catalase, partial [Periconia macrospinosa]